MIKILKFPYTSMVMLIPGYKMSILFAFAVNQCLELTSSARVGKVTSLFFADIIRHFLLRPITRLDVVASRPENNMAIMVRILKFPYTSLVLPSTSTPKIREFVSG
jgi:hypothetical protein